MVCNVCLNVGADEQFVPTISPDNSGEFLQIEFKHVQKPRKDRLPSLAILIEPSATVYVKDSLIRIEF